MSEQETILLVDDSENDHFMMRRAFKKAGFNNPLQEVHNGEQAMAYLQGEGIYSDREKFPMPSAVLLDLNMPRKDGRQALEEIKDDPVLCVIPVIVFTTSNAPDDLRQVYRLGASAYVLKPNGYPEYIDFARSFKNWLERISLPVLDVRKGMAEKPELSN